MKITDDEYLCKICKVATPLKEIKVKRDRSSSTIKLWNHLKRFHVEIYKQLRPSNAPNTLTDYFSKSSKFSGRNSEQTKKECIDIIVKTDAPFTLLDHPQFRKFCNYLVQGEAGIPSRNSGRRGMEKLFEDERDKVRELLRPIERVSLTTDTWTTTNNVAILGITIHWIDDMWRLHEQVLAVEELGVSHRGIILAEVVHRVLEEYDLTQKVSKHEFNLPCFQF